MYFNFRKGLIFTISLVVVISIPRINGGEGEANLCATLFKEENFGFDTGNSEGFSLNDGTLVSNFEEEHVTIDTVWNITKSFQIKPNCVLNACNGPYFDGTCLDLKDSAEKLPADFQNVLSASCTCANVSSKLLFFKFF